MMDLRLDSSSSMTAAEASRDFIYPLEPLRQKRGWQLEQARLQLARAQQELRLEQDKLTKLHSVHDESSRAAARHVLERVEPTAHVLTLAYLTRLRSEVAAQTRILALQRSKVESLQQTWFQAERELEALDQHRARALREHRMEIDRMQAIEADRDWLARASSTSRSQSLPATPEGERL